MIKGKVIPFIIHSGASVNIIDEAQFKKINCVIHKADIKIYTYGIVLQIRQKCCMDLMLKLGLKIMLLLINLM